ncbi:MAG: glycosyltransferase family 4 protein [Rhodospirillaceae bacterium]
MTVSRLAISWQLSDSHGWGVFGLNLALSLLDRGEPRPLLVAEPQLLDIAPDILARLAPLMEEQRRIQQQVLGPAGANNVSIGGAAVLHALVNGFNHHDTVRGDINVGIIFFERGPIGDAERARAAQYERIVAGSSWNRDYARAHGIEHIEFVSQGVDTAVFRPGPRSGAYEGRFTIFSGGKIELRKGQDLVLAAFKIFHQRHPDALLITAWRNAWPETSRFMTNSVHIAHEPEVGPAGELMVKQWAVANGVDPDAFVDLGWVANRQTAAILCDMDAAVFPNRCEGGTNLVAMEAMATGVPCVLSANTGHLDLIRDDNCYPLTDQRPVAEPGGIVEMWRESQVEEIVESLEAIYADRAEARRRAERGAAFMADLSWANQTARLMGAISDLL